MAELLCCKRIDFADYKVQKKRNRFWTAKKRDRKRNRFFFYEKKAKNYFRQKLTTNWSRHSATRTFRHAGAFYYNLAHIDKNEQKKISKKFNLLFIVL